MLKLIRRLLFLDASCKVEIGALFDVETAVSYLSLNNI
jgi:hypothetical protein